MGLSLEEWEEKKSKISKEILEEMYRKFLHNHNNSIEEWDIKKKEFYDCGVSVEFDYYQEVLVDNVMKQHNIYIEGQLLEDFIWAMRWDEESAKEVYLTPDYELAKLVHLLRQSLYNESELTITSTINGVKKKAEIRHQGNLNHLYFLCDSLIYARCGETYQREFDWKEKESYYSKHKEDVLYTHISVDGTEEKIYDNKINVIAGTFDPYSEIELKKIIEYEHAQDKQGRDGYKELRKSKIKDMVLELRVKGIFDKSFKTISTKEACFIFDVLVALETLPHDTTLNNQEKYQYIKRILLN